MKDVQDRIVQYANRYKLTNVETGEILGTFDFDEETGTVQQVGTEIDAELFDSIANDLAKRVRVDAKQNFSAGQKQQARANIDAAATNGSYPTLGAGYLARQIIIDNGTLTAQWFRVGYVTINPAKTRDYYSGIFKVNAVFPTEQMSVIGNNQSGDIEFDVRCNNNVFVPSESGITINSGNLDPQTFALAVDGNNIGLYVNVLYPNGGKMQFVLITEQDRSNGELTFIFDGETTSTTAPSGAVYAVVRNIASKSIETSNNLLLNGTFQLNTQGETIYQSGAPYYTDYFVDGWRMIESTTRTGTVEVIDGGGVKVTGTGASFGIRQTLDTPMAGRTVTGTIKVSNKTGDSILYLYLWNTAYNTHAAYIAIQTDGTYTVTYTIPSDETNSFEFYISYGSQGWVGQTSCIIEWAKLEEGTVSTAPNGLVQNATEALYAKAIPVASQTVFGGAKMWVDGGKLYIKTE